MSDSDNEGSGRAGDQVVVSFDAADSTAEVPFPRHSVFIMPTCVREVLSACTVITIPHPRHGGAQVVFCCPSGLICEVQEHHRGFGQAWIIGDTVEPSSPLFVCTPMDPTFLAIYLLRLGGSDKYVDAHSVMGRDAALALLPSACKAAIEQAAPAVADVLCPSENETYWRFNGERFVEWVRKKYNRLNRPESCASLLSSATPGSIGAVLLAEYLSRDLEGLLTQATGIDVGAWRESRLAGRAPTSAPTAGVPDEFLDGPVDKKKRVEAKSASVKKLEKAGTPQGTPTLMSMFAKKK